MNISCLRCGREVNLNHSIFDNYRGEVKCFSCSSMMTIATEEGVLRSAALVDEEPGTQLSGSSHRTIGRQEDQLIKRGGLHETAVVTAGVS